MPARGTSSGLLDPMFRAGAFPNRVSAGESSTRRSDLLDLPVFLKAREKISNITSK
jgi:hypothetical protein